MEYDVVSVERLKYMMLAKFAIFFLVSQIRLVVRYGFLVVRYICNDIFVETR